MIALVGFALLGFYMSQPELFVGGESLHESADKLFPQYIANQLPVGISGLVVVALFAAVMSSVDSGINAVTAVILTDFVGRFRQKPAGKQHNLRTARYLTVGIGIVIVLLNTFIDKVPGNYLAVTQKTVNLLTAPLFGLFFMALFVPFATQFGAMFGTIYGSATAILVGFWDVITGLEPLSFQWIGPTALIVNIIAGISLSLLPTRDLRVLSLFVWCVVAATPIVVVFTAAFALRV